MFEDRKDCAMSLEGDLVFEDGDLKITTGIDWYAQEVNKRLRSGTDWYHHPDMGVDIARFAGLPNTSHTGEAIREAVKHSLSTDPIHAPATLKVEVVPTSLHDINLIVIAEHVGEREIVSHQIIDLVGGYFKPLPLRSETSPPVKPYETTDNKYLKRRRR